VPTPRRQSPIEFDRIGLPLDDIKLSALERWQPKPAEGEGTRRAGRIDETLAVASVAFVTYLVAGYLLTFRYNSINGDALSRVANAGYVLFSRDPHLAAVGFVWNPLPSFLEMPLLLLRGWFPWLISRGFAGNIMSSLTGALAVWALAGILVDEQVKPAIRWLLILAFSLHPIVLYAGANGMSEAPYLCTLLLGARYLLRWVRAGGARSLTVAGVALAFGYYARYEVIVAGASAILLVLILGMWRHPGPLRARASEALTDGVVIGAPIAFAFATWAVVSWIIVGSPFAQFTSQYGNSAQLALGAGGTPGGPHLRVHYVIHQLFLLEPAVVIVVLVALVVALIRRDPGVLVFGAIFGSILVFEVLAFLEGQTASWLRYYIIEVPMVVLLLATLAGRGGGSSRTPPMWRRLGRGWPAPVVNGACVLAIGAAAGMGIVSGATMVNSPALAREETNQLQPIFYKNSPSAKVLQRLKTEKEIANYIAALHLRNGAVLADVARAFTIWTQSKHPQVFLITPDRDFLAATQDPAAFHVQYLLAEPPVGLGTSDQLNRQWPTLYANGGGIATLVKEFDSTSDLGTWRLYRLVTN
jgi:hypothetical protein